MALGGHQSNDSPDGSPKHSSGSTDDDDSIFFNDEIFADDDEYFRDPGIRGGSGDYAVVEGDGSGEVMSCRSRGGGGNRSGRGRPAQVIVLFLAVEVLLVCHALCRPSRCQRFVPGGGTHGSLLRA